MIIRNKLIQQNLESIITEVIKYYNRLKVDTKLMFHDRKINPIFRKNYEGMSLVELINEENPEPGLSASEIFSYDTTITEDYNDFQEMNAEFFSMYGLIFVQYSDEKSVYIFISDSSKYLKLLKDMSKIPDKIKSAFVKKIDLGLVTQIEHAGISAGGAQNLSVSNLSMQTSCKKIFRNFTKIIAYHQRYDPSPSEYNYFIRKRLIGMHKAFKEGYIYSYLGLENFLSYDEVGGISSLEALSGKIIMYKNKIISADSTWKVGLAILSVTISHVGLPAKPIIEKVIDNFCFAMDSIKNKLSDKNSELPEGHILNLKSIVKSFQDKLENLKKTELVGIKKEVVKREPKEKPRDKVQEIIDLTVSCYFTKEMLNDLFKKIRKAHKTHELPF